MTPRQAPLGPAGGWNIERTFAGLRGGVSRAAARTRSPCAAAPPTPTAPPAPPQAQARGRLPRAAQPGPAPAPRATPVADLDTDDTVPGPDRDRDSPARTTRAVMPDGRVARGVSVFNRCRSPNRTCGRVGRQRGAEMALFGQPPSKPDSTRASAGRYASRVTGTERPTFARLLPPSLFEHPTAELSVGDSAQLGEDRRQPIT